jgi:zinc transporter
MADLGGRSQEKMDALANRGGLIGAYRLNKQGGGSAIEWDAIEMDPLGSKVDGDLWVHLDRTGARTKQWLNSAAQIPASAARSLLEEDPRPRFSLFQASDSTPEGMLFVLRGINLNPDASPEDMVSVRLWIDVDRVITSRMRKVMSIDDQRQALLKGNGPKESADVLVGINISLLERIEPELHALDTKLSLHEENLAHQSSAKIRSDLADVRRLLVVYRRYIAPQREALVLAGHEMPSWVGNEVIQSIRDSANSLARVVDHLDEMRERASAVQDELTLHESERNARISLRLTVIAAVFLPASMIASIWGINAGGIPFTLHPHGFWIVLAVIALTCVAGLWLARGLLK